MRKPTIFSLVREQSLFMTIIMSLLTFLSVLSLGIALSIGTGVMRWNTQWENFATVQVTNPDNIKKTQQIITNNNDKIKSINEISTEQMNDLMSPWVSGGGVLKNYLPKMWEIEFNTTGDLESVGEQLSKHARFLTHATALGPSTGAGWRMILLSSFILLLALGAIGICISYIARNTAMLHRRELEILNQIGASDNFIANQMQTIVAKISAIAAMIGFVAATPVLMLIISSARSARVGLMAMLGLSGTGWFILILLPIVIILFSIWTTRRTTMKILQES